MDLSFGTALKDTAPIPAESRVLQEKFIELATHLHTITQETRVLNLFYRADDQGNDNVGIHIRLHGCIYWTSVRLAHGFHHSIEATRSEEHTSELQSLMRISYAVFCLKKKINTKNITSA